MRRSWGSGRPTATWLGGTEPASLEGRQFQHRSQSQAACPFDCRWDAQGQSRRPLCWVVVLGRAVLCCAGRDGSGRLRLGGGSSGVVKLAGTVRWDGDGDEVREESRMRQERLSRAFAMRFWVEMGGLGQGSRCCERDCGCRRRRRKQCEREISRPGPAP